MKTKVIAIGVNVLHRPCYYYVLRRRRGSSLLSADRQAASGSDVPTAPIRLCRIVAMIADAEAQS